MFYYQYKNKYIFSNTEYTSFEPVAEQEAAASKDMLYYLLQLDPSNARRSFCLSDPSLMELAKEDLQLLQVGKTSGAIPDWLAERITAGNIKAVNTNYPGWESCLQQRMPDTWRIHLVGLGDVGSTLLTGLKLLGREKISEIGIYDIDETKMIRWEFEANQIRHPNQYPEPKVFLLKEEELFQCDMFIFCVTVGIPEVQNTTADVRMAQFEGNAKIIAQYAKKAAAAGFKGIFAVVSDPVDLLCKCVLLESNTNAKGKYEFNGLAPEQIRGYGLGVMHARAAYYAQQSEDTMHYLEEGRAFGPHGEHLVIADSISNYNEELSLYLTDKARTANLVLRQHGYKPYVAPALSSGAIAIMETITGGWHYSATYMGGVYMGARNKLTPAGTVLERNDIPAPLMTRLEKSFKELKRIL